MSATPPSWWRPAALSKPLVPTDSSALYARNVLDFLKLVVDKDGNFVLPAEDDIVAACMMCSGGEIKRKN